MGTRGRFKYICEECQAENWLSAKERGSRFKPHCVECGSTWLEPSSRSRGPEKLAEVHAIVKEQTNTRDKKMNKPTRD